MYLGIDIGGTKTAVAAIDKDGRMVEQLRFPTPKSYSKFLEDLEETVEKVTTEKYVRAGVGAPGKIDRQHGIASAFGNLPWANVPLQTDIQKIVHCPVSIDNDANLAGLSEAMLLQQFRKVLYVTVSTGIGMGVIVDQAIDPVLEDSEGGHILLEHNGKLERWENFASGRAIVSRFGKPASDITDPKIWQIIAHDLAVGLIDLIAIIQPDIIVLGGGVGAHYEKYKHFLEISLHQYENPLFTIPPIKAAARPEQAVLYGCYELAKSADAEHGKSGR